MFTILLNNMPPWQNQLRMLKFFESQQSRKYFFLVWYLISYFGMIVKCLAVHLVFLSKRLIN